MAAMWVSRPPRYPRTPPAIRGAVDFDAVTFGYGRPVPALDGFTLHVRAGERVALIGRSGVGMSTAVSLLLRLYDMEGGRNLLDGIDIREIPQDVLRAQVGMVPQETAMFNRSAVDNIRYGRLDATDEEVYAAARATFVDRFAHSLPDGYRTVLDDESGSVSAGERQLITIARAFLAEPAILILDEATSSVDTRT